jgi:hypothetical protein
VDLSVVWRGDGHNPNAALTVFRHFDAASVVQGLVGDAPKTAWVIGYPLLERIYYLLVAGYDVFGNTPHQLETRLYMDFLRMEGEANFLMLMPRDQRAALRDHWYRGADDQAKARVHGSVYRFDGESGVSYQPGDALPQLFGQLRDHLSPVLGTRFALDSEPDPALRQGLRQLAAVRGASLSWWPQAVVLRVDAPAQPPRWFSVLRNTGHLNVSTLLREQAMLAPDENTLTVVPGFIGAYPNAILHSTVGDLGRLDHRRPTLDLAAQQGLQLGRRSRPQPHAQRRQALLHRGRCHGIPHRLVQRGQHRGRRAGRRGQRIPAGHLHAGHAGLGDGGHLGQQRVALGAGDGQRPHRAGLQLRQHRADDLHRDVDFARAQRRQHRGGPLVGHHQRVDAGARLEQLGRQVLGAAHGDAADVQLAGVGAGPIQRGGQRGEAPIGGGKQAQIEAAQRADRRKVLQRIGPGGFISDTATALALLSSSRVWPSGTARATRWLATMAPAPGWLSTTTGWPRLRASASPTARAVRSAMPPGPKGTTRVIARSGKRACACSRPGRPRTAPAASQWRRCRSMSKAAMPGMLSRRKRCRRPIAPRARCRVPAWGF